MKVTKEKTESSQAFLTIEMEPAEVEESLEKAYRRLVQRANVPGFRKGKAPRPILERYIGKEHLLEDALDSLIPEAYDKAIKEQGIEAIARPQIEVTGTEPVIFKAVVPLKPNVTLGDYRSMQVPPSVVDEVTETQVDNVVEELRHQHATWEPVESTVDFGNMLVVDVDGAIDGQSVTNQKGIQYAVQQGSSNPIPGFAEQLIGLKKGESKEFKLQMPADYPKKDLVGKEAIFKVNVSEIKQEVLPEANDELAAKVGAEFKTLAALRERIMADMKQNAGERAKNDFEERVIEAAAASAQVEFPLILVDAEISDVLNQRFQKGQQELDAYLMDANKTEEQLREELRPSATTRITRSLVLGKVADTEKIEVGEADIDADIENMIKNAGAKKEDLKKILDTPQNRKSIRDRLLTRKTIERLVEIARGSSETAIREENK